MRQRDWAEIETHVGALSYNHRQATPTKERSGGERRGRGESGRAPSFSWEEEALIEIPSSM